MSASLAQPAATPATVGGHRSCVRPGCGRRATTTLRFDYAERTVMLDPLGPDTEPGEYDLCFQHAARSGPPSGWTLRDRAPSGAPSTEPAPPVGPDRGQGVARLAAALSAVPRAVSEDAPDAAPVGTDRPVARPAPTSPALTSVPTGTARPQGSARLDALLQPTVAPTDARPTGTVDVHRAERRPERPASIVRPVPLSERTPEAAVRTVPQPLRLAPDPTTTVWCADLLAPSAGPLDEGPVGGRVVDEGDPTLFV